MRIEIINSKKGWEFSSNKSLKNIGLHLKKNKKFYCRFTLLIALYLFSGSSMAFASGFDTGVSKIYWRIVGIGKWIILVKGAMDTIGSVGNGDFQTAKKNFLSYLLIYGILHALPTGFEWVEQAFKDLN